MQRNLYNLGHLTHLTGHIGRIRTVTVIPVVAGDSIELNINGPIRLAPTRKEIVSECQVDVCAFFVPHRQVIDSNTTVLTGIDWKQYIYRGIDDNQTWPVVNIAADARNLPYLNLNSVGATVRADVIRGYNFIYQRYFAIPSTNENGDDSGDFDDYDFYPNTTSDTHRNGRRYGRVAARLPHILNGGTPLTNDGAAGYAPTLLTETDNYEVPVTTVMDIRDLALVQARYRTQAETAWFTQFYEDVMKNKWGTEINKDVDARPEYLGRSTQFMSGTEINGTDDATLGSAVGKTMDRISFNMPRKAFMEHGNLWVLIVPRYPLVHVNEQHALLADPTPDRVLLQGDPTLWAQMQPVEYDPGPWLAGGSNYTPGPFFLQPYGQEYRFQNNYVAPEFNEIPGYPFSKANPSDFYEWYYYTNDEYRDTFQTSQISQWSANLRIAARRYSMLPGVKSSILAGA